jgi:hypothetical protein
MAAVLVVMDEVALPIRAVGDLAAAADVFAGGGGRHHPVRVAL